MTKEQIIESFQCPGCVNGNDTECGSYKLYDKYGFNCSGHCAGTFMVGIGKILLGFPKGFNRVGPVASEWEPTMIRFWTQDMLTGTNIWDKFNVPVWAMVHKGFLFVRTYVPRVNKTFIDVIEGGTFDLFGDTYVIDVQEFVDVID